MLSSMLLEAATRMISVYAMIRGGRRSVTAHCGAVIHFKLSQLHALRPLTADCTHASENQSLANDFNCIKGP
jgi:hypothetical protein